MVSKLIDPGIVARLTQGLSPVTADWMGPGEPMAPATSPQEQKAIAGRSFDFPVHYNTNIQPKVQEGVSFSTLRNLADNFDLLRLMIETRKDQLENLTFTVRLKDKTKDPDDVCTEIEEFFQMPDLEHGWSTWVRMLAEDMLVIDAPTIYPRMTRGGDLYSLDIVDGGSIKRLLDETGRTPVPPDFAYQQILKGVVATEYTREELIYSPRNLRSNRVYGFSPVEQIIMTVNIALNRQLSQLSFYTEGSSPNMLFTVPEDWNSNQIEQFQSWWDGLLSGNIEERAKTRFIPGGVNSVNTKDISLMNEFDEWLARIVCFAFSVPPTAFTKQTNRATSETMMQQAKEEGLEPLMRWLKGIHDRIILQFWGTGYELVWEDDKSIDPLEQAQVDQIYLAAKAITPDEVREALGRDPLTPKQKEELNPPPPPGLMGQNPNQEKPPIEKPPIEKPGGLAKSKKFTAPEDKPHVKETIGKFQKTVESFLSGWSQQVIKNLNLQKAKKKDDQKIPWEAWSSLQEAVEPFYLSVFVVSGEQSLSALGIDDPAVIKALRAAAVDYAEKRSAELIGKKWVDGELVDNPNAEWAITETTRDELQSIIVKAQEDGWTNQQLAQAIEDSSSFSESRSEMIARSEMANCDIDATLEGWKESGVVEGKQWDAAEECCDDCQELDGVVVPIDEDFPDGAGEGPTLHPRCRCGILAVLTLEDET